METTLKVLLAIYLIEAFSVFVYVIIIFARSRSRYRKKNLRTGLIVAVIWPFCATLILVEWLKK